MAWAFRGILHSSEKAHAPAAHSDVANRGECALSASPSVRSRSGQDAGHRPQVRLRPQVQTQSVWLLVRWGGGGKGREGTFTCRQDALVPLHTQGKVYRTVGTDCVLYPNKKVEIKTDKPKYKLSKSSGPYYHADILLLISLSSFHVYPTNSPTNCSSSVTICLSL